MLKMKTLTIGDKTWQVWDPEAARIDDSTVGEQAWSAKKIIDTLCPAFTAEGDPVVCSPVAGYPLAVVAQIQPVQNGDPTPQAPVPIAGHTALTLSVNDWEQTVELGQTVYSGSLDWNTGLLTMPYKMLTLTGEENVWKVSYTDIYTTALINDHVGNAQSIHGMCSHAPQNKQNTFWVNSNYVTHANASVGGLSFNKLVENWGLTECSVAAWKAFLTQQYEAGTPVQILYKLKTPLTAQLAPRQLPAPEGQNTLRANTGAVSVSGRLDLRSILPAAGIQ